MLNSSIIISAKPLSIEFDSECKIMGYGFYESQTGRLKLDDTIIDSSIVLSDSNLVSVQCEFNYFIDWLNNKNTNKLRLALIKALFSKTSTLELTPSSNPLQRLALKNININGFKNYIFNNALFKVYDKKLQSYQGFIECKQVYDHPAPAIGSSKLVYIYRGIVLYEKILKLY